MSVPILQPGVQLEPSVPGRASPLASGFRRLRGFRRWVWLAPIVLLFAVQWAWAPVVLQPSGSVERGLWVRGFGPVERGDLVLVDTPASVRDLLDRHGQLGRTRLLKPVVAVGGMAVRCDDSGLDVDGVRRASTLRSTSQGEWMPVFAFDRELGVGEAWLLAEGSPTSVDSRCFGPVDLSVARGPYRLWWSWDR